MSLKLNFLRTAQPVLLLEQDHSRIEINLDRFDRLIASIIIAMDNE